MKCPFVYVVKIVSSTLISFYTLSSPTSFRCIYLNSYSVFIQYAFKTNQNPVSFRRYVCLMKAVNLNTTRISVLSVMIVFMFI